MRRTSCGRTGVGDPAIVRFAVVAGARVSQTTTGKSGSAAARGRMGNSVPSATASGHAASAATTLRTESVPSEPSKVHVSGSSAAFAPAEATIATTIQNTNHLADPAFEPNDILHPLGNVGLRSEPAASYRLALSISAQGRKGRRQASSSLTIGQQRTSVRCRSGCSLECVVFCPERMRVAAKRRSRDREVPVAVG
jgi:hypothetical protein